MPAPVHQISIQTSPLAEDAVFALMEREFGQDPSIYTDVATGMATVSVYWHIQPGDAAEIRASLREGLRELLDDGVDPAPARIQMRKVPPRDWSESWKRHFKSLVFGRDLLVKPTWSKRKPTAGQALVVLDPGLSFGTGQHATTRFCLGEIVRSRPHSKTSDSAKRSFLDMGTGSGILAIAAAKLGYSPVEAFDFDPDCVRIARENAALNQLESRVTIHQQDVTRLPTKAKTRFNVVCANLIYDLLIAEAERIASRLQPGGVLILAGILSSQFAEVQSAYESVGLRLMRSKSEKEWCSGAFRVR